MFLSSGKDLDTFFILLNEQEGLVGKVIKTGKVYEVTYPKCYCDLYVEGYVRSDAICECSRQSILFVMDTLVPGIGVEVEKLATVLGGDSECRFRITVLYK